MSSTLVHYTYDTYRGISDISRYLNIIIFIIVIYFYCIISGIAMNENVFGILS